MQLPGGFRSAPAAASRSAAAQPSALRANHTRRGRSGRPLQVAAPPEAATAADLGQSIRPDFPILEQDINGKALVYLDNAATSQKPTQVLDTLEEYYKGYNSNVHRGVHALSAKATDAYETAREKVAKFVNASTDREIVFTRNASEAINLVAYGWALDNLKPGDEILSSVAEHHSNTVPWQLIAQRTGAKLVHVGLTKDTQEIDMDDYASKLGPNTKLVALCHVSNVTGAILPTETVIPAARAVGAKVLLDCCQSVPHMPVDVQALGADWIVASGHKMCAPTGIGFLWGRYDVLESMSPWMGGGEMIQDVFLDHSTFAPPPGRFEAGTPAIGEAIALGAACDYLTGIGMSAVHAYENEIGAYLYDRLSAVDRVTVYGPPPSRGRASLAAFNVEGLHATDVSTIMDASGVAVRSGHHCTQPLHTYLGINASARASAYIYNTKEEVDTFVEALAETIKFFAELDM